MQRVADIIIRCEVRRFKDDAPAGPKGRWAIPCARYNPDWFYTLAYASALNISSIYVRHV